jgi:hypothetical protein
MDGTPVGGECEVFSGGAPFAYATFRRMYKTEFLKLSMIHAIFGTSEVAQTGCHLVPPAAPAFAAATAQALWTTANLTTIATAWSNFLASGNLAWADYSQFTAVKLAACGTDGKYLSEPLIYELPANSSVGTHANVAPQESLVMSLRSGSTFGEANYGRMYLPHTDLPLVAGTPYASGTDANNTAVHFVTWVTAVNSISTGHVADVVVSNMSQKGTGTSKAVSSIGVGLLIDTQRRRRNRLAEDYRFASV